jgi:uncharacterized protein with HEPN domain
MSDASQREWRFYLDDKIDFAGKVLAYTEGLDQAGFVASGLTYDATLRNLELIGEAATHIPEDVRAAYPEIPWRMIIATRNRLIHGYLGIDDDTLWSIIQDDAPELLPLLKALKKRDAVMKSLGLKDDEHFRKAYLLPALDTGLIEMTIPDKPRSSKQKYQLTDKGRQVMAQHGAG